MRKSNTAHTGSASTRQGGNDQGGGSKGDDHSEDDDDDDGSEGAASGGSPSKRNSLTLSSSNANGTQASVGGGMKSPTLFAMDTDKTPTTNTLLSQAQAAAQRPNFHAQATIRRHPGAPGNDGMHQHASSSAGAHGMQGGAPSYIGAPQQTFVRDLPHFPDIQEAIGSDSASAQGIAARDVWRWFEEHLNALLESVRTFRFDQFELQLRTFWSSLNGDHREVVHAPAVAGLMAKADAIVYNVRDCHPYI